MKTFYIECVIEKTFRCKVNAETEEEAQEKIVEGEYIPGTEEYGEIDYTGWETISKEPDYEDDGETYKIIRFQKEGNGKANEVIKTGLTLGEAKEHCSQPDTKGDGWFDGFTKE